MFAFLTSGFLISAASPPPPYRGKYMCKHQDQEARLAEITSDIRDANCYWKPAQLCNLNWKESVVDEMLNHILPTQLALLDQPLHVGQDAVGQVKVLLQVKL